MGTSARDAVAFSIEFQGRTVKRTLLALYDGRHEDSPTNTRIHRFAEMPLNHLGYHVTFHDIRRPLPDVATMVRYRGVVSWFIEDLQAPLDYLNWLEQVTATGVKLVALGEFAPRESEEVVPALNRVLAKIGLRSTASFSELTHRATATYIDPAMIGFERKLDKAIPGFPIIRILSQVARSHLTITMPTPSGLLETHPVTTSEHGGYAAQNFTVELDANTNREGWLLNPFLFFRLALGDERFPIPDVTTVSGRRIYFSHIDGDGWNNMSEVEQYRDGRTLSAEVITHEAIEPYPDLPVSVGLIAGDVQPLLGGNAGGIQWAKRLFALQQVEVASHTHTHPFSWKYFEKYDRTQEESRVRAYRPPTMPLRERLTAAMLRTAGQTYTDRRYDPWIASTDDLPRSYLREPFQLELEVHGALKFSEQFAPPKKPAKLYLWSGDTQPFEAAIAATRAAGVRNMNGGDSRLDTEFPSVAYVPPISRIVGRERQIYSVNSNENTYTNDWTGPFGGQMMLEHTLANTELPRRLKGFNLYYHMYSGEKQASLRAIKHYLEVARAAPVTPIQASDYAAMADDVFGVEIEQVDLFAWAVNARGTVNTVRFDDAEKLALDLSKGSGVVGATRHAGSLYVTLDPAVSRVVIALKARVEGDPAPLAGRDGEPLLSLVEARWRVSNVRSGECLQTLTAQGFGAAEMTWLTESRRGFKVKMSRAGIPLADEIHWADDRGQLKFRIPVNGQEPLDIVFQCHD
jgi:polysaccharide biosynthesis protein PelA